ncbi:MAG: endonuclease III [Pyrinomonadaceae bacterium]
MNASSTKRAERFAVPEAIDEKPLDSIILILERVYGIPELDPPSDPLDMLIGVILSQATTNTNSDRTYAALKKRFPSWELANRARQSTIADTIRLGGLADQKAKVIKDLLRQLKAEGGGLDLSFLHGMTATDAAAYLSRFRGIGPKTAACTLLFACHHEIFPLDTHIFRVLRRVGLIPQKCSDRAAHEILTQIVPPGKFYSFHVNLIRLGRTICRPREPLCERCPIVDYCDYGRAQW